MTFPPAESNRWKRRQNREDGNRTRAATAEEEAAVREASSPTTGAAAARASGSSRPAHLRLRSPLPRRSQARLRVPVALAEPEESVPEAPARPESRERSTPDSEDHCLRRPAAAIVHAPTAGEGRRWRMRPGVRSSFTHHQASAYRPAEDRPATRSRTPNAGARLKGILKGKPGAPTRR